MNRASIIELVAALLVVTGLAATAYSLSPAERVMQELSVEEH